MVRINLEQTPPAICCFPWLASWPFSKVRWLLHATSPTRTEVDVGLPGLGTAILFWLVVYLPLWQIWTSIWMMTFPIYGKIKVMFQSPPTSYVLWCFMSTAHVFFLWHFAKTWTIDVKFCQKRKEMRISTRSNTSPYRPGPRMKNEACITEAQWEAQWVSFM